MNLPGIEASALLKGTMDDNQSLIHILYLFCGHAGIEAKFGKVFFQKCNDPFYIDDLVECVSADPQNLMLQKSNENRKEVEEEILTVLKKHIVPYISKLKRYDFDNKLKDCIDVLESNLRGIVPRIHQPESKRDPGGKVNKTRQVNQGCCGEPFTLAMCDILR